MLDEAYWGFGDPATPQWAPGEQEAYIKSLASWHKTRVLVTKLSNGERVWFTKVYELRIERTKDKAVLERIDEADYLWRKLAGTLESKYDSSEWDEARNKARSRGTTIIGP